MRGRETSQAPKTKIPNRAGGPKPAISGNSPEMRCLPLGGLGSVQINIIRYRLNEQEHTSIEVIQSNFQAGNTEQAFDGKPTPDFLRSPEKPKAINPLNQWLAVLIAIRYSFRRLGSVSGRKPDERQGLHSKAQSSKVRPALGGSRSNGPVQSDEPREEKMITICYPLANADEKDNLSPNRLTKL